MPIEESNDCIVLDRFSILYLRQDVACGVSQWTGCPLLQESEGGDEGCRAEFHSLALTQTVNKLVSVSMSPSVTIPATVLVRLSSLPLCPCQPKCHSLRPQHTVRYVSICQNCPIFASVHEQNGFEKNPSRCD